MRTPKARRGGVRFGRGEDDSDERFVRRFRRFAWIPPRAGGAGPAGRTWCATRISSSARARTPSAALVGDYLGVDSTEDVLAAMQTACICAKRRSRATSRAGAPRLRSGAAHDLSPELRRLTEDVFGPALQLFRDERAYPGV